MEFQEQTLDDMEVQNLEKSLVVMETALTEHYCDIGKSILEIAEKEDKEISRLVDEIIKARKKLAVLQKKIQCPDCFTYNDSGSRYCSYCGKKLLGGDGL